MNLDEGVKLNGKTVYYSQKISEFPTSDFYYTSLNEAQKGVSNGSVGAYIIIPAKFSSNVVTLNERPIASKLDYKISKKLSVKFKSGLKDNVSVRSIAYRLIQENSYNKFLEDKCIVK